jgi:predicted ester cyclase
MRYRPCTMLIRTHRSSNPRASRHADNLTRLGEYSARMAAGDYDAVYEYFAPDFVSHATERISPAMVGTDIRAQEHKFWAIAKAAFPDMEFHVDLLLEVDDLVVSHWTLTGTHTGAAYYDVPASGERVTINGTAILRLRDGQVVEHWGGPHCMHGIGLVQKVGGGPHAASVR